MASIVRAQAVYPRRSFSFPSFVPGSKAIPYSGKFLRAQIFANHQQTRQGINFVIFILATRSQYLTTLPTIPHMEMVTLSMYFNFKMTGRR